MNDSSLQNEIIPNSVLPFQPYFLICKSCFWCASFVFDQYNKIDKCPLCNGTGTTESIPISNREAYSFDYDNQRGVSLEFFRMDKGSKPSPK